MKLVIFIFDYNDFTKKKKRQIEKNKVLNIPNANVRYNPAANKIHLFKSIL